ncbi:50S ribosomal protein L4 [Candidatus Woesearchaeota archaeon]|nr:MAG: 50S ribosomal protein L4 [Candidatus Woesearchaeota archaeon]
MKADVLSLDGKKLKTIDLPSQFEESYRPDLIKRAVLAVQSHKRQPYGADPEAGFRHSAKLSRRRRKYRGGYGRGMSRVPRKVLSRRGTQFSYVGAIVSSTVGGRRAHPPKSEKIWDLKINIKERRKAIRSAISATLNKLLALARGHKVKELPLIVESKIEDLKKAKEVESVLKALGLNDELERCKEKKVRAGKGKARGRKYKRKVGPLLVVSNKSSLTKAALNLPGVDVAVVDSLNAELLAPGTHAGRVTVWSEKAIERMKSENLFTENIVKPSKKEAKAQ